MFILLTVAYDGDSWLIEDFLALSQDKSKLINYAKQHCSPAHINKIYDQTLDENPIDYGGDNNLTQYSIRQVNAL